MSKIYKSHNFDVLFVIVVMVECVVFGCESVVEKQSPLQKARGFVLCPNKWVNENWEIFIDPFVLLFDSDGLNVVEEECSEVLYGNPLLLHGVAVADCYRIIRERVVVDRDAEWCSDSVLTAIAASDGVFFVILEHEIVFEEIHYFACLFR